MAKSGGILAKKYKPSNITMSNLGIGVILMVLYFILSSHKWALAILFFAGFTSSSSQPLLIVMARHAGSKLVIGLKMGIIVGGTWGAAAFVLFILSFIVEKIGLLNMMWIVGSLYIFSFAIAVLSEVILNCSAAEFEIAAVQLHAAMRNLGFITGETADADILGEIFSRFCIGK